MIQKQKQLQIPIEKEEFSCKSSIYGPIDNPHYAIICISSDTGVDKFDVRLISWEEVLYL